MASNDHDDREGDYEDPLPEGAEWCDRCQGSGNVDCRCGGDICLCGVQDEAVCPTCHGEGFWTPTPAQIQAMAKTAEWMRAIWAEFPATPPQK